MPRLLPPMDARGWRRSGLKAAWLVGVLVVGGAVGFGCAGRQGDDPRGRAVASARSDAIERVNVLAGAGPLAGRATNAVPFSRRSSPGGLGLTYLAAPLVEAGRDAPSVSVPAASERNTAPEPAVALRGERAPPSVARVMLADAGRELESRELGDLRGGFLLSPGVAMKMVLAFRAQLNGGPEQSLSIPTGFSGVLTGVRNGVPFVQGSNQFSGLISLVQNDLDFQQINALTTVRFDLYGSVSAVRGSLLRSQMNFNAAVQPR